MMETYCRNTLPRVGTSCNTSDTARGVGELPLLLPIIEGKGLESRVDIVFLIFEKIIEFFNIVFEDPASFRKGAWNLTFSRQLKKFWKNFGNFWEMEIQEGFLKGP
jgi:hypothetical protein